MARAYLADKSSRFALARGSSDLVRTRERQRHATDRAEVSYQGRAWFDGDFFYAAGDSEGNEVNADIWSTDGTNAGTRQETYLGPGTRTSAYGLTVIGPELYFAGGDAAQHDSLWKLAP